MFIKKTPGRNKRIITCGWCEEFNDLIIGCSADDAGYSEYLARMNKASCSGKERRTESTAEGKNQGVCS